MKAPDVVAVMHLDESCLGNGRPGDNPGGAGGLVEVRTSHNVVRRDFYLHAPATTNNRMALAGAIAGLSLLAQKGTRCHVLVVSDSEYLVKGVREWAPNWHRRGWTRKGGVIENLALWQTLWQSLTMHEVQFTWVRGHAGHPKNEYANDLAVLAATRQETSAGLVESGYGAWLTSKRLKGAYVDFDADTDFVDAETRLRAGERFALAEGR